MPGASVAQAQAPTGLGKYLMRSPSGEIILGGETLSSELGSKTKAQFPEPFSVLTSTRNL